jgi:hypothetical protein
MPNDHKLVIIIGVKKVHGCSTIQCSSTICRLTFDNMSVDDLFNNMFNNLTFLQKSGTCRSVTLHSATWCSTKNKS